MCSEGVLRERSSLAIREDVWLDYCHYRLTIANCKPLIFVHYSLFHSFYNARGAQMKSNGCSSLVQHLASSISSLLWSEAYIQLYAVEVSQFNHLKKALDSPSRHMPIHELHRIGRKPETRIGIFLSLSTTILCWTERFCLLSAGATLQQYDFSTSRPASAWQHLSWDALKELQVIVIPAAIWR